MKPIAIFCHSRTEGPGYFARFLDEHHIPWQLFHIAEGDDVPPVPDLFGGLCFLGGPMSVNDPLPWITPALELIQAAARVNIPVIGHCLGGQLMSKAFGGEVTVNPQREIGWHPIQLIENNEAKNWFGGLNAVSAFHWHGDTFSIPPKATLTATSKYCANQMFVMGKHIGMQFHVEMTRELVELWCATGSHEIEEHHGPAVHSVPEILDRLDERIMNLNHFASRIYRKWISGAHLT